MSSPNVFFTSDTHFGHENILKYSRRDKFMTAEEIQMLDAADRGEIDQRKVRIGLASIERMNTALIDNINAVVKPNDVLWHLGDVFWGHNFDFAKSIRDRINCKNIHHVWGNHDEVEFVPLFASSQKYAEVVIEHQKIFLCHYPMRAWDNSHKGSWQLYGHVHGSNWDEDKYGLKAETRKSLETRFGKTLSNYLLDSWGLDSSRGSAQVEELARLLSQDVADQNCHMLTLDVGVDTHDYRPWSMEELRAELFPKTEAWRKAREAEKAAIPTGSRK